LHPVPDPLFQVVGNFLAHGIDGGNIGTNLFSKIIGDFRAIFSDLISINLTLKEPSLP